MRTNTQNTVPARLQRWFESDGGAGWCPDATRQLARDLVVAGYVVDRAAAETTAQKEVQHRLEPEYDAPIDADPPRVVFLDIDGVLVTVRYAILLRDSGDSLYSGVDAWRADRLRNPTPYARFDPQCVGRLNHILHETGAKIVISSSWRGRGLAALREIFRQEGVTGELIGCTPDLDQSGLLHPYRARGHEIAAWLNPHPAVRCFAVLDDDSDMAYLHDDFFACASSHGITSEIQDMVISHLALDVSPANL